MSSLCNNGILFLFMKVVCMIKEKQLKEFISGNFTRAVLSGRLVNNKVELGLALNSEQVENDSISIYSTDLQILRKNPEKLCEYLIDTFLNNNMVIELEYNTTIPYHPTKFGFAITGRDRTFNIALERNVLDILPKDFVSKLELAKREGIIKFLDEIEINKFCLENFDSGSYIKYKTGITYYNSIGYLCYRGLKIKNKKGKIVNYKGEAAFAKKLLTLLIERDNVDLKHLEHINEKLMYEYCGVSTEYELNDSTIFKAATVDDWAIFRQFLIEYLNTYKDEIKGNQLILKLK